MAAGSAALIVLVTSVIVGLICTHARRSRYQYGFEEVSGSDGDPHSMADDPTVMRRTLLEDIEDG